MYRCVLVGAMLVNHSFGARVGTHEEDSTMVSETLSAMTIFTVRMVGEEVATAVHSAGPFNYKSRQEAVDAFDALDANSDGSVSKEEFRNFLMDICRTHKQCLPKSHIDIAFDALDADSDGLIQKDEFLAVAF